MPTQSSTQPLERATPAALDELSGRFQEGFSTSVSIREQHAGVEGHHVSEAPQAVVFAQTCEDVSWLASWCSQRRIPLIAHGAGTSLEGHLSAIRGGITLDLSRMNAIVDVSQDSLCCTVQAGLTREQLNQQLRHLGLFFPIDPGANATLGGMAATRASGTNAVRYGTMRDNVMSVKVVLADGRVIETGTRAAKSSAGYDLTALIVGSEGTLGIITEVTLRLYGIPEHTLAGTCPFGDLQGAVRTVIAAIQMGVSIARIELLDTHQIAACNAYSSLDMPEQPTLFLEFHGSETEVANQVETFRALAEENGAASLSLGSSNEDRSRLWKARHNAYFAAKALIPGARVWTTDVCVPIAQLADSLLATRRDLDAAGAVATIVGHVGDGNYHVMFVLRPDRVEDVETAAQINARMVERAIACGGTCTGEHGIGLGKKDALLREKGPIAIDLMRALKRTLDPHGILNPGKVI